MAMEDESFVLANYLLKNQLPNSENSEALKKSKIKLFSIKFLAKLVLNI